MWSELDGTGVRAVCVHPGGIKTNIEKAGRRVQRAGAEEATFAERAEKVLLTPPDECAAVIIKGARKGARRIVAGHKSRTVFWMGRLFPNAYPSLIKLMV